MMVTKFPCLSVMALPTWICDPLRMTEIAKHPHITFTSDNTWDPDSLDQEAEDLFFDAHDDTVHQAYVAQAQAPRKILPKSPDFDRLRPYFNWASVDKIKLTLENTTQWFRAAAPAALETSLQDQVPCCQHSSLE